MVKHALRVLLAAAVVLGLYTGYLFATGNFHTVIAGQLYRSGQPTAERIAEWRKRYGIKTIVNLRGAHPDQEWYLIERAVARELGVTLIDYPISAKREVTPDQVEELLALLGAAEPPVLIHCLDGADRSGLVAAFYIAGVAHGSEYYAEFQLTPFYGHLPVWFLPYFAMDRSFENAEPRLGFPDS
ncbi:MAG TPA: tyrosine-protein phosphatase [Methyloceanibacter sp.]|nr:tyrosine-protein phosphatase [Methyloceanibacter sp.]